MHREHRTQINRVLVTAIIVIVAGLLWVFVPLSS